MSEKWEFGESGAFYRGESRGDISDGKSKKFLAIVLILPRSGTANMSILHRQRFAFVFNLDAFAFVARELKSIRANALVGSCGIDALRGIGAAEIYDFAFVDIDTLAVLVEAEAGKTFAFKASDCVNTLLLTSVSGDKS